MQIQTEMEIKKYWQDNPGEIIHKYHSINEPGTRWETKVMELDKKGQVLIAVNGIGNEDSDGDISAPGSFKKTLKENFARSRWFLNHDTTKLLGVPIKGTETPSYLEMLAQLNLEKEIGRDTYSDYLLYQEYNKSLEHSIGVQAIKYNIDEQKMIRTVTEWKLWEFSTLTSWGSNSNTPLIGIKALLKGETDPIKIAEILNKVNTGNYSDTRKKEAEHIQSLFLQPSRITDKQRADLKKLTELINF
jgi:HK97 family phage prohead protease